MCKVGSMNIIRHKYIIYMLTVSALLGLPGCNVSVDNNVQAQQTLHIVNVNDKVFYDDAHIKGDIHIPFEQFENLDNETKIWNKNSTIVVYCTDYACTASKIVAKELTKLGFKDVYVYTGGAAEWHKFSKLNPAYQMVGAQSQPYLSQSNEKIETSDPEIRVITAEQLLKKIQEQK